MTRCSSCSAVAVIYAVDGRDLCRECLDERDAYAEPASPTASAAFGDLGLTVGQWTQVRDRAQAWPSVRRRA